MLDDLVGVAFELDAPVEFLDIIGPIAPSCRSANESSPFGFVVLEGLGGGVLLPCGFNCDV